MRQLANEKFYKKVNKGPTQESNAIVRKSVHALHEKGSINDKTARDLVETKIRTPHCYTLPKIDKNVNSPPGRPTVSSIRAPPKGSAHS